MVRYSESGIIVKDEKKSRMGMFTRRQQNAGHEMTVHKDTAVLIPIFVS
jgi:hypothetical protein